MRTKEIRWMIAQAVSHEQQTHTLAQLLNQWFAMTGRPLTSAQVDGLVQFMQAYIQFVPDVLDEAEKVAKKEGWHRAIAPILEAAQDYFVQPFDFIPDSCGLIGLTDDAYLAHTLLQQISASFQQETKKPLVVNDTKAVNLFVRSLIGEPIASMLDQKVAEILQGPSSQDVLSQLIALAGSGSAFGGGSSFNDYAVKEQVDLQMNLITSSYSPSW